MNITPRLPASQSSGGGGTSYDPNGSYVLHFPGAGGVDPTNYGHVGHGIFWPDPLVAAGTVAIANGQSIVTGTGSNFTSLIGLGPYVWWPYWFLADDTTQAVYTVTFVTDDNHLTISPPYAGTTQSSTTLKLCLGTGCLWEAWVKPWDGNGYFISDGYGGSHSVLWGLINVQSGNIRTPNSTATSFNGSYSVNIGEWVHLTLMIRSGNIYCWVNGILDGITPLVGPRIPGTSGLDGPSYLFVGGSDHSNGSIDLAVIYAWDTHCPGSLPQTSFVPARLGPGGFGSAAMDPPEFWADYTRPGARWVPDLSPIGYPTRPAPATLAGGSLGSPMAWGRRTHPGILSPASYYTPPTAAQLLSVPTWVLDPTCPYVIGLGSTLPLEAVHTPTTPPSGVKRYDSFKRRNQTLAFQGAPTLGSTEAGSLGVVPWNVSPTSGIGWGTSNSWGILGGNAVPLGPQGAIAWVLGDSPNMDVQVSRPAGYHGGLGIVYGFQDVSNYYYAIASKAALASSDPTVQLGYGSVVGGVGGTPQGLTSNTSAFTVLRVVRSGTNVTIMIYASGTWTTIFSLTGQTLFPSATGAGMCNTYMAPDLNTYARFSSFALF
jgi:hypothetical protein